MIPSKNTHVVGCPTPCASRFQLENGLADSCETFCLQLFNKTQDKFYFRFDSKHFFFSNFSLTFPKKICFQLIIWQLFNGFFWNFVRLHFQHYKTQTNFLLILQYFFRFIPLFTPILFIFKIGAGWFFENGLINSFEPTDHLSNNGILIRTEF